MCEYSPNFEMVVRITTCTVCLKEFEQECVHDIYKECPKCRDIKDGTAKNTVHASALLAQYKENK